MRRKTKNYESRYLIKDEGGNIIAKDLTYDEIAAMIDNDEISDEADIEEMIVSEANPINLWATVSYKYIAPEGIKIDIVNRFFIPNEFYDNKDGVLRSDGYYLTKSFIADLVDLSNDISGVSKENRYAGGSYYPMGKITYYDDILNVEKPLEGARIVAVSGNICHTGIIDARGDFFIPSAVQGSCRYFIYFYTDEFKVKSSRKNIASLFCKSTADFLTYRISKAQDGINYYYTTVFRAAYYYYNKDVLGTKRPPTVIKIWARDKAKNVPNGNFSCFRVFWGGNTIHIFKPDRSTDQIYDTTIHELTHAAHYSMGKKNYKKTHDIIKESWARVTQYFITLKTYPSYKGGGLQ